MEKTVAENDMSVFRISVPTNKFLYIRPRLRMVCSLGARFILARTERHYIQSSAAHATGTFVA